MAERVVLHVGTMKSGTTFLQGVLFANKEELARRGIFVPMQAWYLQLFAVRALIGDAEGARGVSGKWARLLEQVEAAEGTAVVSVERLGIVRREVVARAVDSFRSRGIAVQVVLTARDLNRSVGSLWQETLQNGATWTWPEYLAGAGGARPPRLPDAAERHHFWTQMNLVRLTRNWAAEAGPENVTVVTVPPPGAAPGLLLERFAATVGFDPEGLVAGAEQNAGCGVASLEVLRRLNVVLDGRGLAFPRGTRARKHVLAKQVLAPRRSLEGKVGHPLVPWAHDEARRVRKRLRKLGVRVVGDLHDLDPVVVPGADPVGVREVAVLEAARVGLAGLRTWYAEGPGAEPGAPSVPGAGEPATVDEAVQALADLVAASVVVEEGSL
jgi:hypothetical protein